MNGCKNEVKDKLACILLHFWICRIAKYSYFLHRLLPVSITSHKCPCQESGFLKHLFAFTPLLFHIFIIILSVEFHYLTQTWSRWRWHFFLCSSLIIKIWDASCSSREGRHGRTGQYLICTYLLSSKLKMESKSRIVRQLSSKDLLILVTCQFPYW